jgi:hypothetical protein
LTEKIPYALHKPESEIGKIMNILFIIKFAGKKPGIKLKGLPMA